MLVMIRGGGDLASGVALRLHRAGIRLMITELPEPLVVRRLVSFADAVYQREVDVEGIIAKRTDNVSEVIALLEKRVIPVLVDPDAESFTHLKPKILIDGRMTKKRASYDLDLPVFIVGLGPGFVAGENCHAAIETNRGHYLGRVVWHGTTQADTGVPDNVLEQRSERVLRAPSNGELIAHVDICDHVESGQMVAEVSGVPIEAPFIGVVRGLIHPGLIVRIGDKIGDIDPRNEPAYCKLVSDKSLAIGGGVLEAILTRPEFRLNLWD